MSFRSNKLPQPTNALSSGEGRISRRSSQSTDTTKDGHVIPVTSQASGTSRRSRASSRIESISSLRPNYYYSGVDLLNGNRRGSVDLTLTAEGSHSRSSLALVNEDLPTSDFVRAGEKRNADFHGLFPMLAHEESLLEDYGCALQREITIQGRIYITERNICFYSSIFGWITDFVIPISTITSLEKKSTAYFIPNAIQITTRHEKFTLSSFLARDATYDLLYSLWCLRTHPEDNGRWSVENTPEIKHRSPAMGGQSFQAMVQTIDLSSSKVTSNVSKPRVTECTCGKEGKHYSEPVVDLILAAPPEQILKLMLDKEFMTDFLSNNQKLLGAFEIPVQPSLAAFVIDINKRLSYLDITMTGWTPITAGSPLLTRELSYIKPLHLWIGPKQTKCEQHEAITHINLDEYVSTVTTTRTPDVPSGHSFIVKTRTCIMWASTASSRVVVTTQVEWTGRSLVKGLIESSAIDGVKGYLVDLVKAVRRRINQLKLGSLAEGLIDADISTEDAAEQSQTPDLHSFADDVRGTDSPYPIFQGRPYGTAKNVGRSRRSDLQLALETLQEASQLAWHGIEAAIRRIYDTYANGISASSFLWAAVMLLGVSNLWLLVSVSVSLGRIEDKLGDILNQLEAE